MHNTLKDIRTQFRLSMNGIVSQSMREKGAVYKLNFGVSLPKIREIAQRYTKDAALAEALWQEDVREMKILATLLQPLDSFTVEQAELWAAGVKQQEIAEQLCMNLLQELPFAEELAMKWICREEEFFVVMGFLLLARLYMKGFCLRQEYMPLFMRRAKEVMDVGLSRSQRASLLALKYYGRQSSEQADIVLLALADYPLSGSPEREEFYEDLKFEFQYYQ
ncbi:DNA alkylation repair protein [Parabacteroides sp. 52]|uniref:DNA alkylation repair protein n=1 Tax=unclassified Parabacteroides TaxID=2649774 RepID=UPI0013D269CC|nr:MULTISPECIES: DNA alkylation repair protein [unclassified Parabacteroides]MDH6535076.1 3-methyladenine DNA glycosylase AlkD [Parabacteroides sp. PM5-20]NDV55524.1 DNA alkylation repair protein [Parabacteroides sp. 52]